MASKTGLRADIERERTYLVRFASIQLRDAQAAEDAVQETLLAALAQEESFTGRSSLRTWLTGILKHKILDTIRRQSRERQVSGPLEEADPFDALFRDDGHWVEHPASWENPDASLEQKQFLEALDACLKRLPEKAAQAFLMREHLGSETDEICKELAVTPNHCWVLLYRARMALQECLNTTWFSKK